MATPAFTDFQPFVPLMGLDIGDLYFSFLSKRTHDLVLERLDQIGDYRPFISLTNASTGIPGTSLTAPSLATSSSETLMRMT